MQTRFRIGEVIAVGLRTWAHNVLPFLVLTAVMESPIIAWGISVSPRQLPYSREDVDRVVQLVVISLLTLPLRATLLSALLTYGVVMELRGQRVSIFACIAMGLRRLPSALGTMVAGCLCLLIVCFVGAIPGTAISPSASALTGGIPALYLASWLYVAPQAAVIDRTDMNGSLVRSKRLTQGHRLALVALLVAMCAIAFAINVAISRFAGGLNALLFIDLAANVVIGSIIATLPCVAYYYLRAEKDGASVEELASVFA